jgi:hypothetical protein
MIEPIPGFDAVEMQHEGARRIYEETKDMTPEQELAYWQAHTEALLQEQRALQQAAERAGRGEEAETLSPEQASELLRRQDALQTEAAEVLADLDLFSLLSRAGTVSQVGSSATGLMAWRDIDIGVHCDDWSADLAFQAVRPLASHAKVKRLTYVNETGRFNATGLRDGYYWGVSYQTDAGDTWKIDIWFWSSAAPSDDVEHVRAIMRSLTPETRLAILWIKDEFHGQPEYRSFALYDAVLNHGVRTPSQFASYLENSR